MKKNIKLKVVRAVVLFWATSIFTVLPIVDVQADTALELVEAERLAIERDLSLQAARERAERYREEAMVATQFEDPQLVAGYEDGYVMEEYIIGLRQEIPSLRSQHLRKSARLHLRDAEQYQAALAERAVLREVRLAWLELWYRSGALRIIEQYGRVLHELAEVARDRYGSGSLSQQQVLAIELEERLQQDRLFDAHERRETARTELARLIGDEPSRGNMPELLPVLPQLTALDQLQQALVDHPAVQVVQERVRAADQEAELAGRSYRGFMVDVLYSRNNMEQDRVGLMFSVPLPIMPGERQDRRAAAGKHEADSMRLERDDIERALRSEAEIHHQRLVRLGQRLALYDGDILPHSKLVTEAVTSGYQYSTDDFFSILRAVLFELENRLNHIRLQADYAGAQAQVLYYQGAQS